MDDSCMCVPGRYEDPCNEIFEGAFTQRDGSDCPVSKMEEEADWATHDGEEDWATHDSEEDWAKHDVHEEQYNDMHWMEVGSSATAIASAGVALALTALFN